MWAHALTPEDLSTCFPGGRFFGAWGDAVEVEATDVIAMPFPAAGEVYCIKRPLFVSTYELDEGPRHGSEPAGADMLLPAPPTLGAYPVGHAARGVWADDGSGAFVDFRCGGVVVVATNVRRKE